MSQRLLPTRCEASENRLRLHTSIEELTKPIPTIQKYIDRSAAFEREDSGAASRLGAFGIGVDPRGGEIAIPSSSNSQKGIALRGGVRSLPFMASLSLAQ